MHLRFIGAWLSQAPRAIRYSLCKPLQASSLQTLTSNRFAGIYTSLLS